MSQTVIMPLLLDSGRTSKDIQGNLKAMLNMAERPTDEAIARTKTSSIFHEPAMAANFRINLLKEGNLSDKDFRRITTKTLLICSAKDRLFASLKEGARSCTGCFLGFWGVWKCGFLPVYMTSAMQPVCIAKGGCAILHWLFLEVSPLGVSRYKSAAVYMVVIVSLIVSLIHCRMCTRNPSTPPKMPANAALVWVGNTLSSCGAI